MSRLVEARLAIGRSVAETIDALCARIAELAGESCRRRGMFSIALSGGSTPKKLYEALAEAPWLDRIAWDKVVFLLGDERCVPDTSPESNYRMIKEALLDRVGAESDNILRPQGAESDACAAAKRYGEAIAGRLGLASGELPCCDLVLLGLGADGHTASLFPGSSALDETERISVANRVDKLAADRITLTLPAINHAGNIAFLVTGESKAAIVAEVIEGCTDNAYPACRVGKSDYGFSGSLEWYLDEACAAELAGDYERLG